MKCARHLCSVESEQIIQLVLEPEKAPEGPP
jgi:hypothetical protein